MDAKEINLSCKTRIVKIFISLWLGIPNLVFAITFTGGYIETEFLAHYGNVSNLGTENLLFQEVRINIHGSPNRFLEIESAFKTSWQPVHNMTNFNILNWIIQVRYKPYYFLTFGVGNVKVDYSQYTIHTEEWQDNIFKGLMAEINYGRFYLHSFVGFHTEATNSIPFQDKEFKTDIGYIYEYYDSNEVLNEQPAIWGGILLRYSWQKNAHFKFIYVHENYRIDKPDYGYYFFYNNIYQTILNFSPIDWCNLKSMFAIYAQDYDAYNGAWDYYGGGKHRLFFDYSELSFYPAYEFGGNLKNPLLGTEVGIYYRYIDKGFNPVHIDNGRWEENRGEDFLDNVYSDTKGFIYQIIQPLYPVLNIGIEYQDFEKIRDGRIFANFNSLFNLIDMLLLYRTKASVSEDKLSGLYIKIESKVTEDWRAVLIYTENKDDIKDYNEFLLNLRYNF